MSWSVMVPLREVDRGPVQRHLVPDAETLRGVAMDLTLPAVEGLTAEVTVSSWLDGVQIDGRWRASVSQTCGVSLDVFATDMAGEFRVRAVPPGSPNLPNDDPEVVVDIDAEDPPDVLTGSEVDIAAYVIEHLALELDPFPRKPGEEWDGPGPEVPESPFAVLQGLKPH